MELLKFRGLIRRLDVRVLCVWPSVVSLALLPPQNGLKHVPTCFFNQGSKIKQNNNSIVYEMHITLPTT
jgi:hypothetical protein